MSDTSTSGQKVIMSEFFDENYETTAEELREFSGVIGINFDTEPELLWIAKEGIMAPLPDEWKPCQDEEGDIYYFNVGSGNTTWEHPCDEYYKALVVRERNKLKASKSVESKSQVQKTPLPPLHSERRMGALEPLKPMNSKERGKPQGAVSKTPLQENRQMLSSKDKTNSKIGNKSHLKKNVHFDLNSMDGEHFSYEDTDFELSASAPLSLSSNNSNKSGGILKLSNHFLVADASELELLNEDGHPDSTLQNIKPEQPDKPQAVPSTQILPKPDAAENKHPPEIEENQILIESNAEITPDMTSNCDSMKTGQEKSEKVDSAKVQTAVEPNNALFKSKTENEIFEELRIQHEEHFRKLHEQLQHELELKKEQLKSEMCDSLQASIEKIRQQKQHQENELKHSMQEHLEKLQDDLATGKSVMEMDLRKKHNFDVDNLKKEFSVKHEQEMGKIKITFEKYVEAIKVEHLTQEVQLKELLDRSIGEVKDRHCELIESFKREQKDEFASFIEKHTLLLKNEILKMEERGKVNLLDETIVKKTTNDEENTLHRRKAKEDDQKINGLLNHLNVDTTLSLEHKISNLETYLQAYQERIEKLESVLNNGFSNSPAACADDAQTQSKKISSFDQNSNELKEAKEKTAHSSKNRSTRCISNASLPKNGSPFLSIRKDSSSSSTSTPSTSGNDNKNVPRKTTGCSVLNRKDDGMYKLLSRLTLTKQSLQQQQRQNRFLHDSGKELLQGLSDTEEESTKATDDDTSIGNESTSMDASSSSDSLSNASKSKSRNDELDSALQQINSEIDYVMAELSASHRHHHSSVNWTLNSRKPPYVYKPMRPVNFGRPMFSSVSLVPNSIDVAVQNRWRSNFEDSIAPRWSRMSHVPSIFFSHRPFVYDQNVPLIGNVPSKSTEDQLYQQKKWLAEFQRGPTKNQAKKD